MSLSDIIRGHFVMHVPKVKATFGSLPRFLGENARVPTTLPSEEIKAYVLARHLKRLGPSLRLSKCEETARLLLNVSALYNARGRYDEAKMYAQSALNAAQINSPLAGLAYAQILESIAGLAPNSLAGPQAETLGM